VRGAGAGAEPFLEPGWALPAARFLGEPAEPMRVMAEDDEGVQACVPAALLRPEGTAKHLALCTRVEPTAVGLGTPLVAPRGGAMALGALVAGLGTSVLQFVSWERPQLRRSPRR
jgi:hypothetical protein